jgi:hypothetical protein
MKDKALNKDKHYTLGQAQNLLTARRDQNRDQIISLKGQMLHILQFFISFRSKTLSKVSLLEATP